MIFEKSSLRLTFSALFRAGFSSHKNPAKEFFTLLIISNLPIFVGALLNSGQKYQERGSLSFLAFYAQNFSEIVNRGAALFFTISIVASIVWLANKESGHPQRRPRPRLFFNVFAIICASVCLSFIAAEAQKNTIPDNYITTLALITYGITLFFYYVILYWEHSDLPRLPDEAAKGAELLAAQLALRKGQDND